MPARLKLPTFIQEQPQLLLFALLATMSSGFGQTFFISLFGGEIRAAFELTHTTYGTLYATATVCSALLLVRIGPVIDIWPLQRVALFTVVIVTAGCLFMGFAIHAVMLWLAFLLVRLGGQGMMAHMGMTVVARYFGRNRGKAAAMAATGFPLSEALFPATAVLLLQFASWQLPWLLAALILLLVLLPLFWLLSRQTPTLASLMTNHTENTPVKQYTRSEALRDPGLYLLLPAILAAPFIVTGMLFHQVAIAEIRGWSLSLVATAFTGFATGHLFGLFAAGPLADRIGGQRLLPLALLPMSAGLFLLAGLENQQVVIAYLGLTGLTQGLVSIAISTMWAERYGIRHLGAIRSLGQSVMVVSTAISPILFGLLLDSDVSVSTLALSLASGTVLVALLARLAGKLQQPAAR